MRRSQPIIATLQQAYSIAHRLITPFTDPDHKMNRVFNSSPRKAGSLWADRSLSGRGSMPTVASLGGAVDSSVRRPAGLEIGAGLINPLLAVSRVATISSGFA